MWCQQTVYIYIIGPPLKVTQGEKGGHYSTQMVILLKLSLSLGGKDFFDNLQLSIVTSVTIHPLNHLA